MGLRLLLPILLALGLSFCASTNDEEKVLSESPLGGVPERELEPAPDEEKLQKVIAASLPDGFCFLSDIDPTIRQEIRYATVNNFVGRKIAGYEAGKAILTKEAALALKNAQEELKGQGRSLKVFDAYRPARAVRHFVRWAGGSDETNKRSFYPNLTKKELFEQGFIAKTSGHSRGSSVDLTIVDLKTGNELPMGTHFDYFDLESSVSAAKIDPEHAKNRALLLDLMKRHGFVAFKMEWWHYRLKNEPFPKKSFDFVVR